jgi:hypothetical protein
MNNDSFITDLQRTWATDRWRGVRRPYSPADIYRLRGSVEIEYSLAKLGARRLWRLLNEDPYVPVLSAVTGNQAVQEVTAGLKAIYVSGWQVAADMNEAMQMYPDQSLYPSDSVPALIRRVNNALRRADEIHHMRDDHRIYWLAPIVADAEAGFGGPLQSFEIMKDMIEQGAAGVHFEDQLASVKKVRPPGRQGAGPDSGVQDQARGCKAGRGRMCSRYHFDRADRCEQRDPVDERHRPLRSAIPDRREDARRVLPGEARHCRGHFSGAGVCPVRRSGLVRDVQA